MSSKATEKYLQKKYGSYKHIPVEALQHELLISEAAAKKLSEWKMIPKKKFIAIVLEELETLEKRQRVKQAKAGRQSKRVKQQRGKA